MPRRTPQDTAARDTAARDTAARDLAFQTAFEMHLLTGDTQGSAALLGRARVNPEIRREAALHLIRHHGLTGATAVLGGARLSPEIRREAVTHLYNHHGLPGLITVLEHRDQTVQPRARAAVTLELPELLPLIRLPGADALPATGRDRGFATNLQILIHLCINPASRHTVSTGVLAASLTERLRPVLTELDARVCLPVLSELIHQLPRGWREDAPPLAFSTFTQILQSSPERPVADHKRASFLDALCVSAMGHYRTPPRTPKDEHVRPWLSLMKDLGVDTNPEAIDSVLFLYGLVPALLAGLERTRPLTLSFDEALACSVNSRDGYAWKHWRQVNGPLSSVQRDRLLHAAQKGRWKNTWDWFTSQFSRHEKRRITHEERTYRQRSAAALTLAVKNHPHDDLAHELTLSPQRILDAVFTAPECQKHLNLLSRKHPKLRERLREHTKLRALKAS